MTRATVLLADDHAGNKRLLRRVLEGAFDVVADVDDGSRLVNEAERLSPDAIVTVVDPSGFSEISKDPTAADATTSETGLALPLADSVL